MNINTVMINDDVSIGHHHRHISFFYIYINFVITKIDPDSINAIDCTNDTY